MIGIIDDIVHSMEKWKFLRSICLGKPRGKVILNGLFEEFEVVGLVILCIVDQ